MYISERTFILFELDKKAKPIIANHKTNIEDNAIQCR